MATYELITASGTVVADTATIQSEVETEYREIFGLGEDDEIDPSTTTGRFVEAETTSRVSVAVNNALLANQINPDLAESWAFDALNKLLGNERTPQTRSICDCLMSGVVGTIIDAGSYAQDDNDELWTLVGQVTIPASGSITATFRSENYGAINAAIGAINSIVSGEIGWETINNEVAATPGRDEQTLIAAKIQRNNNIGANSRSVSYSVIAAVSALEGVIGVQFRENSTNSSLVIDSITMPSKSSWLCVDGGVDSEIAEAYYTNRYGTSFYGFSNSVTESYTDDISGQVVPVIFDTPTEIPVKISISAKVGSTSSAAESIRDAVMAYAAGEIEGSTGFMIGEDVLPFEISWAVNEYVSPAQISVRECKATTVADDVFSSDPISLNLWQKATLTRDNIAVTVVT